MARKFAASFSKSIARPIQLTWSLAIAARRNDGDAALALDLFDHGVGIVTLVGNDMRIYHTV